MLFKNEFLLNESYNQRRKFLEINNKIPQKRQKLHPLKVRSENEQQRNMYREMQYLIPH